jgi:hypothetical protein
MKTRIIHTKIWSDSYFRRLERAEKIYFFYILTNELVNIIHLYELPDSVATMQTGLSVEEIENIKGKFQADKKFDFYGEYVSINNAYKYQYYKGIKNNRLKLRLFFEMSDDTIKHYSEVVINTIKQIEDETLRFEVKDEDFINLYKRLSDRLSYLGLCEYTYQDTPIPILRINQKSEIINYKSEIKNQNTEIINQNTEDKGVDTELGMARIRNILEEKGIGKKIGGEEAFL